MIDAKRGLHKNDLLAANQDYLSLSSPIDLELGSTLEITVDVDLSLGISVFGSSVGLEDYIGVLADGRLFVQQNNIFQTATTTYIESGLNKIVYRRALDGSNFVSANGGVEQELTLLDNTPFTLEYIGRRTSAYYTIEVYDFSINGQHFPLNEVRGEKFYSEDKTVEGTRLTSHSGGLEYIEETMIQRYGVERGERKNKLVSSNADYFSLDSTVVLQDVESFEFNFYLSALTANNVLCAMDDASCYVGLDASGGAFVQLTNATGSIPPTQFVIGDNQFIIRKNGFNFYIQANGNTERLIIGDASTVFEVEKMNSFFGSFFTDITHYDFTLNDQVFKLNEHNGDKFYKEGFNLLPTTSITTVEANDQKISLSKAISIGDKVELTFILDELLPTNNYFLSENGYLFYLRVGNTGQTQVLGLTNHSFFIDGVTIVGLPNLSTHVGKVITYTGESTLATTVNFFNGGDGLSTGMQLIEVTLGTETFAVDEGTGTITTGSEGTVATLVNGASWGESSYGVGTRETSHAGGINYINEQMVCTYVNDINLKKDFTPSADSNFYASIYDADMIDNLTVASGVTLTLTKDIFVKGTFTNNGTVVGGTVHEVYKDLVLENMAYSWESDLGVEPIENVYIQMNRSNNDKVSISKSTNVLDEIRTVFILNDGTSISNHQLFTNTGLNQRVVYIGATGQLSLIGVGLFGFTIGGIPYPISEDLRNHIGEICELRVASQAGADIDFIGGLSGGASSSDFGFFEIQVGTELFKFDEFGSSTITGSEGTVGTLVSDINPLDMWKSDLGVQSWVDNIGGISLDAPSPTQRPIYDSADADFNGLPSLGGEVDKIRSLMSESNLAIDSDKVTIMLVVRASSQATNEAFANLSQTSPVFYIERLSAGTVRVAGVESGNSRKELVASDNVSSIYTASWDISLALNETDLYIDGVQGVTTLNDNNGGSIASAPFSLFSRNTSAFPSGAKIVAAAIYTSIKNISERTEIESYYNNKYL